MTFKSILEQLDEAEKAATQGTWTGNTKVGLQFIGTTVSASGPVHHFDSQPEEWACNAANKDADLIRLMRDNIRALIDVAKAAEHLHITFAEECATEFNAVEFAIRERAVREALSKLNGGAE